MTASTLLSLADKVEKLTGPCRETDALIELEVGPDRHRIREIMDGSPHNTIDEVAKAADRESGLLFFRIPRYTASIDAAMSLLTDKGWDRMEVYRPDFQTLGWTVHLEPRNGDDSFKTVSGFAPTFPLALLAAALRARTFLASQEVPA
jgi:hypothetical protein